MRNTLPRSLLVLAIACSTSGSDSAPIGSPAQTEPSAPAPATAADDIPPLSPNARTEDEENTVRVFRAAAPATVFVTQTQMVVDRWSMRALEVPAGTGSGFIWDDQGHVVTNYHVVDGGRTYTVTLYDQSTWPAKLIGGDPRKDIAVLKIDAPQATLTHVRLPAEAYELEVGQKTIAIGNPFGLDHTLTTGVVSALGREVLGYGNVTIRNMIQTDASINPGNSGGPLLDSSGQLIGMNTMIFSQSGSSAGIGFAVPVNTIRRVVDQIVTTGHVEQVGIGVSIVDDRVARRAGVNGVAILEVTPNSPAAQAGLTGLRQTARGFALGDVIVKVDGEPIRSYDDLYNAFDERKAGETVKVTVVRDGTERDVNVPLILVSE